jgi:hypothetical protein
VRAFFIGRTHTLPSVRTSIFSSGKICPGRKAYNYSGPRAVTFNKGFSIGNHETPQITRAFPLGG